MPHSANPIRTAAKQPAAAQRIARAAAALLLLCAPVVLSLIAGICAPSAHAQRPIDLGFTYSQERTKFVGTSTNDFFRLRGATVDVGYGLWHGLGIALAANGLSATNQRESIDVHQASFLVGPRYTYNYGHITPSAWNRHVGTFVEAKVGYTFATSGLFPISGTTLTNHAAALTYSGGGGINLHIYHRFDIRALQVDYVQSHLPNGGTNQQNNLRFSAGINFHLGN